MPRHIRSTPKDKVINLALGFVFILKFLAYWLDMRYCRVVRYFRTTAVTEIIKDFLATLVVAFLILYSPVCIAITVMLW